MIKDNPPRKPAGPRSNFEGSHLGERGTEFGRMALLAFACGYPLITWYGWIGSTYAKFFALAGFTTLVISPLLWQLWQSGAAVSSGRTTRLLLAVALIAGAYAIALLGATVDAAVLAFTVFAWCQFLIRPDSWTKHIPTTVRRLLLILGLLTVLCTFATSHAYTALSGNYYGKTGFISFGCCTLIFISVCLQFSDETDVKRAIGWMLKGSFVAATLGLWQFFDQDGAAARLFPDLRSDPRSMGTSGHPNWFSTYLLLLFPLAVYEFFSTRKLVWGALCGLLYANLLTAQTRGAWVAVAVFILLLFATQGQFRSATIRLCLVLALITAFLAPWNGWQILNRAGSLKKEARLASTGAADAGTGRFRFWSYSLEHLPRHAILGSGLDTYAELASTGTKAPNTKAHSIYFEYALTIGVPGLLSYLAFLWSCTSGSSANFLQWTFRATIITYLIQGIFIHDTLHSWPLVWLIAGLALVTRRRSAVMHSH